ncbi:MAG: SRPBCC family protein [Myxococcaceae bacterium]|nr:SRPBCC family protein [Myxococcaceae bacterium]
MAQRVGAGLALAVGLWATHAIAEETWRTVLEGPVTIRTREVPGSDVHEYEVTGALDAPAFDLQATLTDPERFPKFMPHVTEARILDHAGNVDRVYTRIDPPMAAPRDYVTEVTLVESVRADGTGTFRQTWHALTDALPERSGVTRITINEGSWVITPTADGRKSRIVYRFRVDPGGWVPGFVADLANKKAIPETLRAIEREAQRRGRERDVGGAARAGQPG